MPSRSKTGWSPVNGWTDDTRKAYNQWYYRYRNSKGNGLSGYNENLERSHRITTDDNRRSLNRYNSGKDRSIDNEFHIRGTHIKANINRMNYVDEVNGERNFRRNFKGSHYDTSSYGRTGSERNENSKYKTSSKAATRGGMSKTGSERSNKRGNYVARNKGATGSERNINRGYTSKNYGITGSERSGNKSYGGRGNYSGRLNLRDRAGVRIRSAISRGSSAINKILSRVRNTASNIASNVSRTANRAIDQVRKKR